MEADYSLIEWSQVIWPWPNKSVSTILILWWILWIVCRTINYGNQWFLRQYVIVDCVSIWICGCISQLFTFKMFGLKTAVRMIFIFRCIMTKTLGKVKGVLFTVNFIWTLILKLISISNTFIFAKCKQSPSFNKNYWNMCGVGVFVCVSVCEGVSVCTCVFVVKEIPV